MKNSQKKAETLVSVIIVVVIIAVAIITLLKIIDYDNSLNQEQKKANTIAILEANASSIVKKIDTTNLEENDIFFIYQTGSSISILTGSQNQDYSFVNTNGEYINSGTYMGYIYTRQCILETDSSLGQNIKCTIKEMIKK